ncbi:MAG: helix-turn-helix transcriptional regulator [Planctomycetes bacterium]|nr:helix-turn-helix transcriptional regulator [Planctomycetota bacterium]
MLRLQPGHYFGKPTRTRMFGEFRIVATRYEPDTSLPTHCHEQAYLLVSLRGTSIESALHRDHVCSRGSVVFNQAGESHRDQISREGAEALNVELPLSWLDRVVPRMRANPVLYRHVGGALHAVGALQIAMSSNDPLATFAVEEAVTAILDSLSASDLTNPHRARWLNRVEQIVRDRRGLPPSLDALADEAGVHPAHLCRQFRKSRGKTISEFAACVRSDRALEQVLGTSTPLAQISVECGFSDQAHMTRMFRRFFKTTPGRVRRETHNRPCFRANCLQDGP